MLFHNTSDLWPTVQASSSYFCFSGYFIFYISMLLPAVSEVNQGRFLKAPNFLRNLAPDFTHYLSERPEMSSQ